MKRFRVALECRREIFLVAKSKDDAEDKALTLVQHDDETPVWFAHEIHEVPKGDRE